MIQKMVAFVEDYKLWAGEGNGYIRKTERPEDIGLIKTEVVVDGLKRYWYTFEPSSYKRRLKDKFPLIIAIHGFHVRANTSLKTAAGTVLARNAELSSSTRRRIL